MWQRRFFLLTILVLVFVSCSPYSSINYPLGLSFADGDVSLSVDSGGKVFPARWNRVILADMDIASWNEVDSDPTFREIRSNIIRGYYSLTDSNGVNLQTGGTRKITATIPNSAIEQERLNIQVVPRATHASKGDELMVVLKVWNEANEALYTTTFLVMIID